MIGLASCKAMVNEMKKVNRLRKIVKESCECKFVTVDKGYEGGNLTMDITITKSWSEDRLLTSENVYQSLQDSMPKICNYGRVTIVFEMDDFDEHYIYYGCGEKPEIDTLFYDQLTEDDWDTFMEDSI